MPSGAKKRKAAKKKKENKASSSNTPTSIGDEDTKHQSDGDHNSEHHLTEGEEEVIEKREERIEGNDSVGDVKNETERVEQKASEEEGVIQIERELKPDPEFDKKKGGLSSVSSSSSDDESPTKEKDIVVVDNSVKETSSTFSPEKVSLLDQEVPADSSASADNSLICNVVGSEQNKNGERKSSSLEESTTLVEVVKDLIPEHKKDEVADRASDRAADSDANESATHESEDKPVHSYNVPRDGVMKDGEHVKDSEVLGYSEGQPICSGPRPVQTTSWKSCCGLFEVLTGSNR